MKKKFLKIPTRIVNKFFLTKPFFTKFIKLKRSNFFFTSIRSDKMQSPYFLDLFFLEKNKFKQSLIEYKHTFLKRKLTILHKKTDFLQQMSLYLTFNWKYFPTIKNKRFIKWLFRYKKNKFFKSKLKKINFFFLKEFIFKRRNKTDVWDYYYITWEAYFNNLHLGRRRFFSFKKWILNLRFNQLYVKKLFNNNKKLFSNAKIFLSNTLSNNLKIWFFLKSFWKKILKFWKKIFPFYIWIRSLKKIFKLEHFMPYNMLVFQKSILKFSNSKIIIFPFKNFFLKDYKSIEFLFFSKLDVRNITKSAFINIFIKDKKKFSLGFNFFNSKRIEKLLVPVILFFRQYKRSYLIPLAYSYIDMFLQKKNLLPFGVKKLLNWLLVQLLIIKKDNIDNTNTEVLLSEDTENNKLTTLLFYNFLNEIFNIIFTFSPGNITYLHSKEWHLMFKKQLSPIIIPFKNWEFLNYYSSKSRSKKWYKFQWNFLKKNILTNKKAFLSFYFFLWPRKIQNYKVNYKNKLIEKSNVNLNMYISKNYNPITYIWSLIFWWMFFNSTTVKSLWFRNYFDFGKNKYTYDSLNELQGKFWSYFLSKWTSLEWLMLYGFSFRNGILDLTLDWNFTIGYKGELGFQFKKKTQIKFNSKKLFLEKLSQGYFTTIKNNFFFSSFFSFLNWNYLLEYYLQFGHGKSNYNTSYKDYLIFVYNERFILNLLNIQFNLKWNFNLMFKMFYFGGFICLVGAFNILLEGLVSIYGAYSQHPFTWFIWVNGSFSNFDKIFWSIQVKISNSYTSKKFFDRKMVWNLMKLWFCLKGLFQNLTIDISFFPSLVNSSWVFLEACAKFYPTITTSNTSTFLPTVYLEYTTVSNDYSLLSLSLYINILLILFKWSKLIRQSEFSVYPQKLLSLTYPYKIIPINIDLKNFQVVRQAKVILSFIKWSRYIYFEYSKDFLSNTFNYLFLARMNLLNIYRKQNFWKLFYFNDFTNILKKKMFF